MSCGNHETHTAKPSKVQERLRKHMNLLRTHMMISYHDEEIMCFCLEFVNMVFEDVACLVRFYVTCTSEYTPRSWPRWQLYHHKFNIGLIIDL